MDNNKLTLSYLMFIETYLDKGHQEEVPLFERLKYIASFSLKLNEFISSTDNILNHEESYNYIKMLYEKRDRIFHDISIDLTKRNIVHQRVRDAEDGLKSYIHNLFYGKISPEMDVEIINESEDIIYLKSDESYIASVLGTSSDDENKYLIAKLPRDHNIIYTRDEGIKYILIEDVLLSHVNSLAVPYDVKEAIIISLTRNKFDSRPVKLDISGKISDRFKLFLENKLLIDNDRIFESLSGLSFQYVYELENILTDSQSLSLRYKKLKKFDISIYLSSIRRELESGDVLLDMPYESAYTSVKLLEEAVDDISLIELRAILSEEYDSSEFVDAIEKALRKGVRVKILVELKRGIGAERIIPLILSLENLGAEILYYNKKEPIGFNYYQLLLNDIKKDELSAATYFSTGSFYSKYDDNSTNLSLLTADKRIAKEVAFYFDILASEKEIVIEYKDIIAGKGFTVEIVKLIENERIKGSEGRIFIKAQNLTSKIITDKLISAAKEGVKIKLLISGMNAIDPEKCNNNIQIKSISGRYEENSKVYLFGSSKDERIYISSADLTEDSLKNNNLAVKIKDEHVLKRIKKILYLYYRDDVDSRIIGNGARYIPYNAPPKKISVYDSLSEETDELRESIAHLLHK